MGPMFRPARKNDLKRTIKYLSVCPDPKIQSMILKRAPDPVYKAIFNAAYNIAENPDIVIPKKEKRLFKRHRRGIEFLVNRSISFKKKRKALQKGGAFPLLGLILPAIISTAISALGSAFLNRQEN